jgi:hypothetical protein
MSKGLVVIEEDRLLEIVSKAVETAIGGYFKDVPYNSLTEEKGGYLTREEAANELRIVPATLSNWVREGIIQNRGKGRKMLFKASDIKKLK